MAMGGYPFVAPNFGDSAAQGAKTGFDSIMEGMQQAQQQKMASLAFQGQTGFDPQRLMQGQQINQRMQMPQPMPQGYQGPQTPTVGGSPMTAPQRDLFQEYQQFTNQSRAGAVAKTADVQSQADLRQSQANLNNIYAKNLQGSPGEPGADGAAPGLNIYKDPTTGREFMVTHGKTGMQYKPLALNPLENLEEMAKAEAEAPGSFVPSKVTSQFGGQRGAYVAMIRKYNSNYNDTDAEALAGAKIGSSRAAAVAPWSAKAFGVRAGAVSLLSQIPEAVAAAEALNSGDVVALNKVNQAWGTQISDGNWDELRDRVATIADEFQAQIGQGSDKKLDLAVNLISTTKSPRNIVRALNIVKQVAESRKSAFGGDFQGAPAGTSPKTGAAPAPKSAGGGSDMVRVISPDGQSGQVPRAKLSAAIKNGFKQVK